MTVDNLLNILGTRVWISCAWNLRKFFGVFYPQVIQLLPKGKKQFK